MALKFEDLTEEQVRYCFNGVGSDHFPIDPHDLIFREPAKRHDAEYWIGGNEEDRSRCDKLFYSSCLSLVRERKIPARWFCRVALEVYAFFLFGLGKFAFEYGPKPQNWEELKSRVDSGRESLRKSKRKWRKYLALSLFMLWLATSLLVYCLV